MLGAWTAGRAEARLGAALAVYFWRTCPSGGEGAVRERPSPTLYTFQRGEGQVQLAVNICCDHSLETGSLFNLCTSR